MQYVHDLLHMYIGLQEKVTVGESAPGGSAAAEGGGGGQGASVKYLSSRWVRQLFLGNVCLPLVTASVAAATQGAI